jgi:hypothetical protein
MFNFGYGRINSHALTVECILSEPGEVLFV